MIYKNFVFGFFGYIPRVYAYNENSNMSFSIGMTEIQKRLYDLEYGEGSWESILINSMKRLINNYYESRPR